MLPKVPCKQCCTKCACSKAKSNPHTRNVGLWEVLRAPVLSHREPASHSAQLRTLSLRGYVAAFFISEDNGDHFTGLSEMVCKPQPDTPCVKTFASQDFGSSSLQVFSVTAKETESQEGDL